MKPCTILAAAVLSCLYIPSAEAALYQVAQTIDLVDSIFVEVELNDATQQATLSITGPNNKWFGVGFGNNVMQDTYAILRRTALLKNARWKVSAPALPWRPPSPC